MRFVILPLLLTLAACSNSGSDNPPTGGGTDDTGSLDTGSPDEEDLIAPAVVDTSPENNAVGQLDDTQVVITFSEPMDAASVEAALTTDGYEEVELSWNDTGDELTVFSPRFLRYGTGAADDPSVSGVPYQVAIAATATDRAGNPLEHAVEVNFRTARELWWILPLDAAFSRTMTPGELMHADDDPLVVGDTADDLGLRSTLSFDLTQLPGDVLELKRAVLQLEQLPGDVSGSPYTDLGELHMAHVSFGALEGVGINHAFNSRQSAHLELGQVAQSADQRQAAMNVTDRVIEDWNAQDTRSGNSQYLLYFTGMTDLDGMVDRAVFSRDQSGLEITYVTP